MPQMSGIDERLSGLKTAPAPAQPSPAASTLVKSPGYSGGSWGSGGGFNPANPFGTPDGADPYQGLRNKAQQDAGNAQAQNMDAITRRFAAMGDLNSGSYIQAQKDIGRQAAQQAQDQTTAINMGEQQAALPYAQMQQQAGQFGAQLGQQESQFESSLPLQSRQLDLVASQQGLDAQANEINKSLGEFQNQHSGGLFGGGGTFGLGIDSGK